VYIVQPDSSVFTYFVRNGVIFSSSGNSVFVCNLIYFISDSVIFLVSLALMAQF
jgi:hypothetical protein